MSGVLGGLLASLKSAPAGSYESIATVTVGAGGSSSISFTSIPSTYKHLQVRFILKDSIGGNENYYMGFNSDQTGTNYSYHAIYGNGTSAGSNGYAGASWMYGAAFALYAPSVTANTFVAGVTDILDYTNTSKYKTVRSLNGIDANGSGNLRLISSVWQNTSAINSIVIRTDSAATIQQYSSIALYGVKG